MKRPRDVFASVSSALGRSGWFVLGLICLMLGFIGAFLPLMPTTVFVLIAAFCFSKSSPKLEAWLVNSALFGPAIRDWRTTGAIAPRYKMIAIFMMGLALAYSIWLGLDLWLLILQGVLISGAALFILTRPNS